MYLPEWISHIKLRKRPGFNWRTIFINLYSHAIGFGDRSNAQKVIEHLNKDSMDVVGILAITMTAINTRLVILAKQLSHAHVLLDGPKDITVMGYQFTHETTAEVQRAVFLIKLLVKFNTCE